MAIIEQLSRIAGRQEMARELDIFRPEMSFFHQVSKGTGNRGHRSELSCWHGMASEVVGILTSFLFDGANGQFERCAMETWQAFLLGMMVAYTPSLVFLAVLLQRGSISDWMSQEAARNPN